MELFSSLSVPRIERVTPLSMILIHVVGFPAAGALVSVPTCAPAPLVNVPVDVSAAVVTPGTVTAPLNVAAAAVIGASALSSASRKFSAVALRLIDGKLDVVPPNWRRAKSVSAKLARVTMPVPRPRNRNWLDTPKY